MVLTKLINILWFFISGLRFMSAISYFMSAISCFMSAISKFMSAISYFMSAISYFMSAISCFMSAISCFMSAISCFMSAISCFTCAFSNFMQVLFFSLEPKSPHPLLLQPHLLGLLIFQFQFYSFGLEVRVANVFLEAFSVWTEEAMEI